MKLTEVTNNQYFTDTVGVIQDLNNFLSCSEVGQKELTEKIILFLGVKLIDNNLSSDFELSFELEAASSYQ